MTVREALGRAQGRLSNKEKPLPALDASLLMAYTLNSTREKVLADFDRPLSLKEEEVFFAFVQNREEGEPLAYLLEKKEFWGLSFFVNNDVLIPRPETEILVEKALSLATSFKAPRILDLCTGSGCIAIALKKSLPMAEIHASDISVNALTIAKKNAEKLLDKSEAITWHQGDLFSALPERLQNRAFDIIVSNPPYLNAEEMLILQEECTKEPSLALDGGGNDGLALIRRLIPTAAGALKRGGYLLIESGGTQVSAILSLLKKAGFNERDSLKDLANIPRVSFARLNNIELDIERQTDG